MKLPLEIRQGNLIDNGRRDDGDEPDRFPFFEAALFSHTHSCHDPLIVDEIYESGKPKKGKYPLAFPLFTTIRCLAGRDVRPTVEAV